ncbi:hypothetical protein FA15DRAFT_669010 [Coprinopsis marcescibilis]|uniref:YTH domain-containing protein n=1 Tax=Coprinopsis marcescibilis TaxID=230819 RepID=A0A5C3KYP3_COPMA|nr:hypothetical protein FA15DRAFT_669010 [Coprinopsis marcescibilis]
MVESKLNNYPKGPPPSVISLGRETTPYQFQQFENEQSAANLSNLAHSENDNVPAPVEHSPDQGVDSFQIHDLDGSAISTLTDLLGRTGQSPNTAPGSMPGDASSRSTPSVRGTRSRWNDRRRSFNSGSGNRSSSGLSAGSPPSPGFLQAHGLGNDAPFQNQPFHYPSAGAVFSQGAGFYGQYTVPVQSSPLNIGQPHPSYSYSQNFYHSALPDGNPIPLTPQHAFQQQLHSLARTTPGSSFAHHQLSSNPNATSGATSPIGHPASSYRGQPHYPGMGYSPPIPSPQYGYPQQFSATPPIYPQYGPLHYRPQQSSPSEMDGPISQGSWYFFSHNPGHPYEGSQYRPGFPTQYPPSQTRETGAFVQQGPRSSTPRQSPSEPRPVAASPPAAIASTSPLIVDKASPTSSRPASSGSRPVVRREYHPRPPAHRSQWVMWVGNVPSDATEKELWEFFTRVGGSGSLPNAGVESIFLIGRSNCAFVNFNSADSLNGAINTFNGLSLRPTDPQCPMLVCRIRRSADDLKSGVGGQRGMGIHKQWVREQSSKSTRGQSQASNMSDVSTSDEPLSTTSGPDHLVDGIGSLSLSGGSRPRKGTTTSSSDSFASTTSSFLAEYFPTRFFILKSLSEDDLNISVQNGLWATQKHNELLLDQAFRTSKDVYLIFSVNKSGEFYGYGRMSGPIRRGEGSVTWATRSEGSFSPSSPHPFRHKAITDTNLLSPAEPMYFESEGGHLVDESPLQLDDLDGGPVSKSEPVIHPPSHRSAPPKLGGQSPSQSERTPSLKFSLDQHERRQALATFELDPEAPFRAVRGEHPILKDPDGASKGKARALPPVGEAQEPTSSNTPGRAPEEPPGWGECFKVEWLEQRRIPFHRTRHLRNPWNKGREIKVSRDGTELEPTVGKQLLNEWPTLAGTTQ